MMLYSCKICSKEIKLSEIDFEGKTFCGCGGMELKYIGTAKNYKKKDAKRDALSMILSGVKSHFRE